MEHTQAEDASLYYAEGIRRPRSASPRAHWTATQVALECGAPLWSKGRTCYIVPLEETKIATAKTNR